MAAVSQEIYDTGDDGAASVTMTFDDVTGVISHLDWIVNAGTLTVTVARSGLPDLVRTATSSDGTAVPAGYVLTPNPRGGWSWTGTSYEIAWHA